MSTTSIQRRNLKRAQWVRLARARLRGRLTAGELTAGPILRDVPPEAASWELGELLMAQRGWGDVRARRLLDRFAISENRSVAQLTLRQRLALSDAIAVDGVRKPARRCRVCGCVDAAACTRPDEQGRGVVCCQWVARDLCSACADADGAWSHPPRAHTDPLARAGARP